MEIARRVRKAVTIGCLTAGMKIAQHSRRPGTVESMRWVLRGLTRVTIPLRMRLARNMRAGGAHRPGLVDEHFERAIDHLIMLAHIFRAGFPNSGNAERFKIDASIQILEQAYAAGKGVITIAPHLCGFPAYGPMVSPRVPCDTYLRRNASPAKMRITESIARTANSRLICPAPGASKAERLQVAIDVLREGRVLYITPDTPRKPNEGVPVKIFGRRAYFPTGVFVMSARTGAPVVPVLWHWADGVYHVRYETPIEIARGGRLREQTEAATVKWSERVNAFLQEHPAMWWNWLDKRWTRILRDNDAAAGQDPSFSQTSAKENAGVSLSCGS